MTSTDVKRSADVTRQPIVAFVLRALVAALVVAAVTATYVDAASRTTVNPFNFFGFFTMQSNLILAGLLAWMCVRHLRPGATSGEVSSLIRGIATTNIVIVGLVYALLLAPLGAEGGVPEPWANTVLHIVTPIYAVLDWLVFGDRQRLSWRRLWVVLVYPLGWIAVVLVRGATDGWVPYPFLDPELGYGVVSVYAAAIAVSFIAVGALVWRTSAVALFPRAS